MGRHRHAQHPAGPQRRSAISSLYRAVLGVCVTIFVLVGGWLLYIGVRFRERRGDTREPPQMHGSTRLEIGWTIVPVLIVIGALGVHARQDPHRRERSRPTRWT